MRFRHATAADVSAVVELARHFVEQTAYGEWLRPFDATRFETLTRLALDLGVVFLVELEGAAIAFLAAVVLDHPMTGQRYVEELAWWVEPAHRDSTIGPALLEMLEAWAVAKGIPLIKMVAPIEDATADGRRSVVARYYQHHGYAAAETAYFKRVS